MGTLSTVEFVGVLGLFDLLDGRIGVGICHELELCNAVQSKFPTWNFCWLAVYANEVALDEG